jgi:TetR/AcrR family transcriptional repressor of nem operon
MARKKDFDEDELLEKAVNLFWRKGYHATSAQDLVDELKINRSSLYNTYTDKKTLFTKSLRQYQQKQTNAMLVMLDKAEDAVIAITQIFDNLINESVTDALLKGCFMVNTAVELAGVDEEVGVIVNENNKSVEDGLTKLIERSQQSGKLTSKAEPRGLARFIFANITGIKVAARTGVDRKTLQDIADVAISALK